jgi:hypothetical protein
MTPWHPEFPFDTSRPFATFPVRFLPESVTTLVARMRCCPGRSGFFHTLAKGDGEGGRDAHVAQLVEHVLGKDEVTGSIPVMGFRLWPERQMSKP